MVRLCDGPASRRFHALEFRGNCSFRSLSTAQVSEYMRTHVSDAPRGECVCRGIPFRVKRVVLVREEPVSVRVEPFKSRWLVFLHTSDEMPLPWTRDGFISPMRGEGHLGEHAADYVVHYADGSSVRLPIKRRFQIGALHRHWGENCFLAATSFFHNNIGVACRIRNDVEADRIA